MLADFHIHSTFCDGKSRLEETVETAIEKGFDSIGFSGHGTTEYDMRYCMKDMPSYIAEVNALKEKYKEKIQIYLGVEEDSYAPVDRNKFDYIIGSSHYVIRNGVYYPVDSGKERFLKCLDAFGGDHLEFAESYYKAFCDYINSRKPDIIGHFDLITKYEETDTDLFFRNVKYWKIAEKYVAESLKSGCFYEVNTGAIARELRTSPYPHARLLKIIKDGGGKIVLSSDCHFAPNLAFRFDETKAFLRDAGFRTAFALYNGKFIEYEI